MPVLPSSESIIISLVLALYVSGEVVSGLTRGTIKCLLYTYLSFAFESQQSIHESTTKLSLQTLMVIGVEMILAFTMLIFTKLSINNN